ncbi:MAG: hypothetical protein F4W89_09735 [Acidobacteria bacterium]|nr:hypothetical protein [Acidobacteriota bacterium]
MQKLTVIVAIVTVVVASLPPLVEAGPIRESAERAAVAAARRAIVLQDCDVAATQGREDARDAQGRTGWFAGGLILGVIMPIVAHVSAPQPSANMLSRQDSTTVNCYTAGYSAEAKSRRVTSSWLGTAVWAGVVVAAVAAADDPYSY